MSEDNKKYVKFFIVIVLAAVAVIAYFQAQQVSTAIAPTSMAVQVPEAINTAIQIGVIALLTAGFTWLFNVMGVDFRGFASVLGLALSTWIVTELQNIVNTLPEAWDPFVSSFFYLIVMILAPAGALFLAKKNPEPDTLL